MPDPAVFGHTMADIAERSQRIVADWLKRMPKEEHETDPLNIGSAFMEMTARLMANPARLMQAQFGLWQDYMSLWQNTARRMMGIDTEPVINSASGDRRFKDSAWKDNEIFDFIKQSYLLSARYVQDVVTHVEGLDDKTAQKVDFYAKQFVDAMSPSNFVLTNPGSAAQNRRDRRREPAQGAEQPVDGSGAGQRQAPHQDDRHGRLQTGREHRRHARKGRLSKRSDAVGSVQSDNGQSLANGRC